MTSNHRSLPIRLLYASHASLAWLIVVSLAGCNSTTEIVTANRASVNAATSFEERDAIMALVEAGDYDALFAQREQLEQLAAGDNPQLSAAAFAALMTVDGYIDPAWKLAWNAADGFTNLLAAMPLLVDSHLRIALAERAMPLLSDDSLNLLSGWPADQRLAARRAVIASVAFVPGREAEIREALEAARKDVALRGEIAAALKQLEARSTDRTLSPPRKAVRQYTMSQLEPALDWPAGSRSFAHGRRVYHELGCHRCHIRSEHDTLVGPHLTGADYNPSRRELAEAIIDPNKRITDDYRQFLLVVDGKPITGLVTEQTDEYLIVIADPMFECTPDRIEREQLDDDPQPLATSAMPSGIVDVLALDELLDLLAYVESKGDARQKSFRQRELP